MTGSGGIENEVFDLQSPDLWGQIWRLAAARITRSITTVADLEASRCQLVIATESASMIRRSTYIHVLYRIIACKCYAIFESVVNKVLLVGLGQLELEMVHWRLTHGRMGQILLLLAMQKRRPSSLSQQGGKWRRAFKDELGDLS